MRIYADQVTYEDDTNGKYLAVLSRHEDDDETGPLVTPNQWTYIYLPDSEIKRLKETLEART